MAIEDKDGNKPISSGMAPGPTEHMRDDALQATGTGSTAGSMTGSTTGKTTGGKSALTSAAGSSGGVDIDAMSGGTGSSLTSSLNSNPNGSNTQGRTLGGGKASESVSRITSTAKQYAGDMTTKAKEKGRTLFEQQKETAVGQVGSVAQAIRSTASNLEGSGQAPVARYINMAADQLESLGTRLRDKDLDSLMNDAQNLVRRSPGTFFVGTVITGFLLARFLRASSQGQQRGMAMSDQDWQAAPAGQAGTYSGRSDAGYTAGTDTTSTGRSASTSAIPAVGADGTPSTATGNAALGSASTGLNGTTTGGTRL